MIGIGPSLLSGRRAGKAGPPVPPFNKAMADAWFMSGLSDIDRPGSITGVTGNGTALKDFAFTSESGFGKGIYDGAPVFDGADDYGICTGPPVLDDYTVICRRVLENNVKNAVASKSVAAGNGAFIFEYGNNAAYPFSEYTYGPAVNLKDSVSYQTKDSYNGSTITAGNADDTDTLALGIVREGDSRLLKGAVHYFALYNKSFYHDAFGRRGTCRRGNHLSLSFGG